MKGIAFYWDSPWKDIYSGLDPMADAWGSMAKAFGLELAVIVPYWPFPDRFGVNEYRSLEDFLKAVKGDTVVLADYKEPGEPNPDLKTIDWLVFGPTDGWQGRYSDMEKWCYRPSPNGGYHAVHLAHIAAHISKEVDKKG